MRVPLFIPGEYVGTSGRALNGKIECDHLTNAEVEWFVSEIMRLVGPFGRVEGVPRGGLRIADVLRPCATEGPLLIVDDVWTTGGSMVRHRAGRDAIGCVLFARGPLAPWCKAVWLHASAA